MLKKFTPDNCWYRDNCKRAATEQCKNNCIVLSQMRFLVESSGLPYNLSFPVPLQPSVKDVKAFEQLSAIKNDIVSFVQGGNNLYIFSNMTGNGKTTWSSRLLLKYFDSVRDYNAYRCRGLFIPVLGFLMDWKQKIDRKNMDIYKLYDNIKVVDVVVWDDIGVSNVSPADLNVLFSLVEHRLQNGLCNIFTSNLDGSQLEQFVGNRLYSRIWNSSTRIELAGGDRRNGIVANTK